MAYYKLSLDGKTNKLWRKKRFCRILKRKKHPTKPIEIIFQLMLARFRRIRTLETVYSKLKITEILDEVIRNDYFGTTQNRKRFYHLVNRITTQSRFECIHKSNLSKGYNLQAIPWLQKENLDETKSRNLLTQANVYLLDYIVAPLIKHFYHPLKSFKDYDVKFIERRKWHSFQQRNFNHLLESGHLSPARNVNPRGVLRIFPKTDCNSLDYRPLVAPYKKNMATKQKFKRISQQIEGLARTFSTIGRYSLFDAWQKYIDWACDDEVYCIKLDVKDAFGSVNVEKLCEVINKSNFNVGDKQFIINHIQNQFVTYNKKMFKWNHGLLQGDHLSSSLCNLYISLLERDSFKVFLKEGIFLHRIVDDYMFCTTEKDEVDAFNAKCTEIFQLNESKTERAGFGDNSEITYYGSVLSKPPTPSHEPSTQNLEVQMSEEAELLKTELDALKEQIANLKAAVQVQQREVEQKEMCIAKLARDKEALGLDLLKTKRSNVNLSQQLEDERKFYFKEKEMYCREMNECKKLKQVLSGSATNSEGIKDIDEYKSEVLKLKLTLNQTLEANYNLSIKFLRMKNTKSFLKTELQTMKLEHEKLQNDYKGKIENLTADLNDLVNDKLSTPISPSSKKYLQLVKQNSCLVYENLCLQLEVDNLNLKFERLKLEKTRSETNDHLKYIHHDKIERYERKAEENSRRVRIQNETPEKLERANKPCCSRTRLPEDEQIVKIYERNKVPGLPNIKIINEKHPKDRKMKRKREVIAQKSDKISSNVKKEDVPEYRINVDENCKDKIINKNLSKLALFQVSNAQSVVSSDFVSVASSIKRSQSTPDILMKNEFKKVD